MAKDRYIGPSSEARRGRDRKGHSMQQQGQRHVREHLAKRAKRGLGGRVTPGVQSQCGNTDPDCLYCEQSPFCSLPMRRPKYGP